jgi:hypothetical protein
MAVSSTVPITDFSTIARKRAIVLSCLFPSTPILPVPLAPLAEGQLQEFGLRNAVSRSGYLEVALKFSGDAKIERNMPCRLRLDEVVPGIQALRWFALS